MATILSLARILASELYVYIMNTIIVTTATYIYMYWRINCIIYATCYQSVSPFVDLSIFNKQISIAKWLQQIKIKK